MIKQKNKTTLKSNQYKNKIGFNNKNNIRNLLGENSKHVFMYVCMYVSHKRIKINVHVDTLKCVRRSNRTVHIIIF